MLEERKGLRYWKKKTSEVKNQILKLTNFENKEIIDIMKRIENYYQIL